LARPAAPGDDDQRTPPRKAKRRQQIAAANAQGHGDEHGAQRHRQGDADDRPQLRISGEQQSQCGVRGVEQVPKSSRYFLPAGVTKNSCSPLGRKALIAARPAGAGQPVDQRQRTG
jgi:hypothetical protein